MTCIEKWILYNSLWWSVQWLDQEEAPKYFPKPNLHHRKVMVTVWWSTPSVIHYSFLNPSENFSSEKYAQQIGEMHQTLQHCSWHRSTDRTQFVSMTMPGCRLQNTHFKSWTNWATKFCLICHIHLISCQSTTTSSSISMSFCGENASTNNRRQKMLSKSSSNPEPQIFMLQE